MHVRSRNKLLLELLEENDCLLKVAREQRTTTRIHFGDEDKRELEPELVRYEPYPSINLGKVLDRTVCVFVCVFSPGKRNAVTGC